MREVVLGCASAPGDDREHVAPTALELRALMAGQGYWVAVESFDEQGVSAPSPAVRLP